MPRNLLDPLSSFNARCTRSGLESMLTPSSKHKRALLPPVIWHLHFQIQTAAIYRFWTSELRAPHMYQYIVLTQVSTQVLSKTSTQRHEVQRLQRLVGTGLGSHSTSCWLCRCIRGLPTRSAAKLWLRRSAARMRGWSVQWSWLSSSNWLLRTSIVKVDCGIELEESGTGLWWYRFEIL